MFLIKLKEMFQGVMTIECKDEETRMFTTREKAENWLKTNGFFYGQRDFFTYRDNAQEWCHPSDKSWHYIDVTLYEYKIDDDSDSKFKQFNSKPAPWLVDTYKEAFEEGRRIGYIKSLREISDDKEFIRERFFDKFGEYPTDDLLEGDINLLE